ncbi:fimbria/pilus periplasmic chaperone [Pseudomonas sp. FP2196]|uniref:fimbrial biogenesis chaperone n=1 Tax=Pseudomonas sp. FP2196 TaxID=2954086 RepID=UPI002734E1BD|nr:fimbria/pilus periplasmic chaperone [Pseudomonas sp. FP2196]WLH33116.1 fimbria/pilus periplasmic chaperone [Pseudomonas sp. FP2196]
MLRQTLSACLVLMLSAEAMASISLSATRVVFDGAHKEANITVRNGAQDTLIQSWIDQQDTGTATPFAVTPPLARVFAKDQQLLRILYEGQGMPQDKESVVWLNVQEIPQTSKTANTLQLAVRQRIKIFFRPKGLSGDALTAPTELQWRLAQDNDKTVLRVKNPTLYHVSMADVTLHDPRQNELATDSTMIAPGAEASFSVTRFAANSTPVLTFSSINDYGALSVYRASLSESHPVSATLTQDNATK